MNKRLILHIGQYKTGTTAIQHVLAQNRALLLSQGILYPEAYTRLDSHALLNKRIRRQLRQEDAEVDMPDLLRAGPAR